VRLRITLHLLGLFRQLRSVVQQALGLVPGLQRLRLEVLDLLSDPLRFAQQFLHVLRGLLGAFLDALKLAQGGIGFGQRLAGRSGALTGLRLGRLRLLASLPAGLGVAVDLAGKRLRLRVDPGQCFDVLCGGLRLLFGFRASGRRFVGVRLGFPGGGLGLSGCGEGLFLFVGRRLRLR